MRVDERTEVGELRSALQGYVRSRVLQELQNRSAFGELTEDGSPWLGVSAENIEIDVFRLLERAVQALARGLSSSLRRQIVETALFLLHPVPAEELIALLGTVGVAGGALGEGTKFILESPRRPDIGSHGGIATVSDEGAFQLGSSLRALELSPAAASRRRLDFLRGAFSPQSSGALRLAHPADDIEVVATESLPESQN
jgi:hypothetical protein